MNQKLLHRLQLAFALLLPIQFILFKLLTTDKDRIELGYSQGVFPVISSIQKALFGWIPFSLGQFVFYVLLAWFLVVVYKSLKQLALNRPYTAAKALNSIAPIFAIISVVYFLFMMLWGFNYHRVSLAENLNLEQDEINVDDLEDLAKLLIKATNSSRNQIGYGNDTCLELSWKNFEYFDKAKLAFEVLGSEYAILQNQKASVKSVAIPQLMSLFGLGGIYFPFTGEANVNMDQPDFKLPFTICHEMAHQAGIGSEAEANFVAYLACIKSDDAVFNYSGNFMAMRYVLHAVHRADSILFNSLIVKCDKGVMLDLEANTLYWETYETPLDDMSRWFNDLYLKSNGQKDGVLSYGKMVELMVWKMKTNNAKSQKNYTPKPKNIAKPTVEEITLPYSYTCKELRSVKLDTSAKVLDQFVLVQKIKNSNSSIAFNLKSLKYQLLITNNQKHETIDLCYNNPFGKVIIDESATINIDLSVEINATILNCNKINDSLTVCDSIFDSQFYEVKQNL